MGLRNFVREWRELFRFRALPNEHRSIVIYAEDQASWRHFKPIVDELVGRFGKRICYITSSVDDPVLRIKHDLIDPFYIGFGSARTTFFLSLRAGLMVMTMPDLANYNIKRSKYPVHYVYVFHSLVSSHMVYRPKAFDHFDSILCVGPHHIEEIKATEALYNLVPKQLVQAGYGLLDSIVNDRVSEAEDLPASVGKRVLIAPSWGPDALLETCGQELVEILLEALHKVTVRAHIMTMRQNPGLLDALDKRFGGHPNFTLDRNLDSQGTVSDYDLMISDWSGAALEFAFGLERPVLYIDVPQKINNPDYEKIGIVPIEVRMRSEIGAIISPDHLGDVPQQITELCGDPSTWSERIRQLRERWVYNTGNSGEIGASYIAELVASGMSTDAGN